MITTRYKPAPAQKLKCCQWTSKMAKNSESGKKNDRPKTTKERPLNLSGKGALAF